MIDVPNFAPNEKIPSPNGETVFQGLPRKDHQLVCGVGVASELPNPPASTNLTRGKWPDWSLLLDVDQLGVEPIFDSSLLFDSRLQEEPLTLTDDLAGLTLGKQNVGALENPVSFPNRRDCLGQLTDEELPLVHATEKVPLLAGSLSRDRDPPLGVNSNVLTTEIVLLEEDAQPIVGIFLLSLAQRSPRSLFLESPNRLVNHEDQLSVVLVNAHDFNAVRLLTGPDPEVFRTGVLLELPLDVDLDDVRTTPANGPDDRSRSDLQFEASFLEAADQVVKHAELRVEGFGIRK